MMEEEDQNEIDDIGAENVASPMTKDGSQSEISQRKRKRAAGTSGDGSETLVVALQKLFEESGKRMERVTEVILRGNEDRSDIALELKNMGLSPRDQIKALTLILEKPQTISVFKSLDDSVKEVFVQDLLGNNA